MGSLPCSDFVRTPFCLQNNDYGRSALHLAASWGHLAIVKRLLEGGADLTLRDEDGYTALDYARQQGKSEVVALLSEPRYAMSDSMGEAVYKAAYDCNEAELRRLIDLGGNVNWHNPEVRRRMCLAWAPASTPPLLL